MTSNRPHNRTQEYTLDNGLRLIVQTDHRAPVVVSQLCYKVGSADEPLGLTGISHALEHMMFKGTPQVPADGYSEIISKQGGTNNAFTTDDFTAYYAEVTAEHLPLIFELEADRMINLSLNAEDFTPEIKVIMEERRMRTDDNPQHLTFERYMAVANPSGPYHHPVIGWMQDIENLKIEDLRQWYAQWYRPDNAVLIVVGDVKQEQVWALAQQYFGPIKKPATALPLPTPGPTVDALSPSGTLGFRQVQVKVPAQLPYLIMGFDVPTTNTSLDNIASQARESPFAWEPYALLLVACVLDGGQSARLMKNLVRDKEVATFVNADYEPFKRYATQFNFSGIPKEGVSMGALKQAIWDEINLLKTTPLSDRELQKIKTQLIADEVFQKDSMANQALDLGDYEGIGLSWKQAHQFINKIKTISAEQIVLVLNKYFIKERLTVAILEPQTLKQDE